MMEHFARAFTALLVRQAGSGDRELAVAVTALATGLAEGHVCIDTAEDEAVQAVLPALKNLRSVVGAPGDFTPLVLDGTLLYLGRYWHYERSVASAMRRLAAPVTLCAHPSRTFVAISVLFFPAQGCRASRPLRLWALPCVVWPSFPVVREPARQRRCRGCLR